MFDFQAFAASASVWEGLVSTEEDMIVFPPYPARQDD
jgi:hypothetical protein